MRSRLSFLLALLAAAAGLGLAAPVARASCVGASIDPPSVLVPAVAASVTGRDFFEGCPDTVSQTGCSAPVVDDPARPMSDVALVLLQGGRTYPLGRADSDAETFAIRWEVLVPADVRPGPAQLSAGTATLDVTVAAAP